MFMKMLIKGGILIGGLALLPTIVKKLDKSSLKRYISIKKEDSQKEVIITEEQLKEAFEEAHRLADELESKGESVYHEV